WEYPTLSRGAYADADLYAFWAQRDPIAQYARRLEGAGIIGRPDVDAYKRDALALVEQEARAVIEAAWPEPSQAGTRVYAGDSARDRIDPLEPAPRLALDLNPPLPPGDMGTACAPT